MITQWAGINVITSYMVNIFMEAGSSIDPSLAPILVCTIQQILALVSTAVLRVSPRKPLFLICASAIALSQAVLGTYSYTTQQTQNYGWVPLLAVISVNAFRTIGFMAVIQLLLAESFPTEIRLSLSSSLMKSISYCQAQPQPQLQLSWAEFALFPVWSCRHPPTHPPIHPPSRNSRFFASFSCPRYHKFK